jgi:hypothetical protein
MENDQEEKRSSGSEARTQGQQSAYPEARQEGLIGSEQGSCKEAMAEVQGTTEAAAGDERRRYVIYALLDENQDVVYVGRTQRPKLRLYEHRSKRGPAITMKILQRIFVGESPAAAESKWIQLLGASFNLENKITGIVELPLTGTIELKHRISAVEKGRFARLAEAKGVSLSGWVRMNLIHAANIQEGEQPTKKSAAKKKSKPKS